MASVPHIEVKDLVCAYGDYLVLEDVSFKIERGEILVALKSVPARKPHRSPSTRKKARVGSRKDKVAVGFSDVRTSSFPELQPHRVEAILTISYLHGDTRCLRRRRAPRQFTPLFVDAGAGAPERSTAARCRPRNARRRHCGSRP